MKYISALLLILILSGVDASYAQEEKKPFIRKGLIRSMATISQGIVMQDGLSITLHGTLEYYVADNVSLRGDSYYFLPKQNNGPEIGPFEYNHAILSGASYHFKTKNNFDPYLAFEPGVAITKGQDNYFLFKEGQQALYLHPAGNATVNPLLSSALGFNLYFQRWFHLFGEVRYMTGKYLSHAAAPLSLNELRFSFGLGFNLNLLKNK